jgi:3-dehydroquinate dehydratase-2
VKSVLVLNGPNLNLLGTREPGIYGRDTLDDIRGRAVAHGADCGLDIDFRQSNSESDLISWIQEARGNFAGIIINAGAYTHTSVALHDALLAVGIPTVEVHLSNLFKRETFRHTSFISPVAIGMIAGFGAHGYLLAIDALAEALKPDGGPAGT